MNTIKNILSILMYIWMIPLVVVIIIVTFTLSIIAIFPMLICNNIISSHKEKGKWEITKILENVFYMLNDIFEKGISF